MIKQITNQHEWQEFVDANSDSNFLHSWLWGNFQESLGRKVYRFGVYDDNRLVLVIQTYIEPARRAGHLIVVGGPIGQSTNREFMTEALAELKQFAKHNKCVFVRIRPQTEASENSLKLYKELGLKLSPMPLSVEHAGIIDLSLSNDEIVAAASQSFRRKLRKTQALDIELIANQDLNLLDNFYDIHADHAHRQKYVPFTKKFLVNQFQTFADVDQAILFTAKYKGQVIAQNYIIYSKHEASYHYGVSTAEGVKLSAAPLLHLMAMDEARRRGCSRYNFWGIVDLEATSHRYYGVSQFKRSFGVTDLKHLPAHDLIISKPRYRANWLLEVARKKRRKL